MFTNLLVSLFVQSIRGTLLEKDSSVRYLGLQAHKYGTACCRYLRTNQTWWCIRSMCTDRTLNPLSVSIAASRSPTLHTLRSIIAFMPALNPSSVFTVINASLSRCIFSNIWGMSLTGSKTKIPSTPFIEVIRLSIILSVTFWKTDFACACALLLWATTVYEVQYYSFCRKKICHSIKYPSHRWSIV